jgi:lipoprotein-anchoring transpeptidase ErfK/SrfK
MRDSPASDVCCRFAVGRRDSRTRWAAWPPTLRRLGAVIVLSAFVGAWGGSPSSAAGAPRAQQLVTLLESHAVWSAPRAGAFLLGWIDATRPITGAKTTLPVVEHAPGGWLRVRLPGRPNGRAGWIRQRATAASSTSWALVVDRAQRQLRAWRAGRLVRTFRAIVGKQSTPTPAGTFFVEEPVHLSPTAVGAPYALALSARSAVFQEFDGGPGQIAVHGLANVGGLLGTAVSHGCVRVSGEAMRWLVGRVGAGTPVTITG